MCENCLMREVATYEFQGFGWNRRSFLSALGLAAGSLTAAGEADAAGFLGKKHKPSAMPGLLDGSPIVPITSGLGSTGDIYAELGVTPLVNINGTVTVIGGSVMKPEVMELIRRGNEHFVLIDELEIAAGKFIAKLCKSPAEGYTGFGDRWGGGGDGGWLRGDDDGRSGAAHARHSRCRQFSEETKSSSIQKSHRYAFDHQIRQTGAKLVEVETREQMIAAINPKTVAIHFTNILSDRGQVSGAETVEIAKAHNLYTFNDASADVPPKERLWEYPAIGFDMVTFSGGKDICGPQASGVLIGKEELIRYSLMNMSPQEDRIGRCCKVGKETIFGLLKALEIFVNQDFETTLSMYDERAKVISEAVHKYGVSALPREFNPQALGNVTPRYSWKIDSAKLQITWARSDAKKVGRHAALGDRQHGCGRERHARTRPGRAPCTESGASRWWTSSRSGHLWLRRLAA